MSLWELSAWGFAASKIEGMEKAGLTSAIAIAIGSVDKQTSKKLQAQWDLSDLLGADGSEEDSPDTKNIKQFNAKKTGDWNDLVNFFTDLGGKI